MTFLIDIIQSVFKPSVVALSVCCAVAVVSLDTDAHMISANTVDLSGFGCGGMLKPICTALTN